MGSDFANVSPRGLSTLTAPMPAPLRTIPARREELQCQISILANTVDALIVRLQPVLSSAAPEGPISKDPPLGDVTAIGLDLLNATRQVQQLRQLLEAITERIEL